MMTSIEKIELALILLFVVFVFFMKSALPITVHFSTLILSTASLLLLQSLFRDLWYLLSQRFNKSSDLHAKQVQCMCVESTVGIVGVIIGLLLFFVQVNFYVVMNIALWLSLIGGVLMVGFIIKDYVFEWNPWRLYKDKDHLNIVFSWKKVN